MAKPPLKQLANFIAGYAAIMAPLKMKRGLMTADLYQEVRSDGEWDVLGNVEVVGVRITAPGAPPVEGSVGGGAEKDTEKHVVIKTRVEVEFG